MTQPASGDTSAVVSVDNLTKRFDDTTALGGISFTVAPGELFGFIGPDGGGKTTLFRILVTLLLPTSGHARVLGYDVVKDLWALRKRVGYMPGRFSLYPDLSVEENLRFFASVFGTTIAAGHEIIAPIYDQLAPFKHRRAGALSGGMKQKLALSCALVHRPDILFLDEPTTGVDAVSRREFWELLARLKRSGLTIVVSTPYMDEAGRCDRVALIQRGTLLAIDTPAAVAAAFDRPLLSVSGSDRQGLLRALRAYPRTNSAYPFGESIHYTDARTDVSADAIVHDLSEYLAREGHANATVAPTAPTIEDSFMARMGAPEGEAAA